MKKQVFNPYLPLWEYVPDGEPHVFGERVYLYGSHDRFDGKLFCEKDYVCWSAPVDDLSDWRREGVIYRRNQEKKKHFFMPQLWAPDVCRGPDGKYYLYYCGAWAPRIGVAVCDTPAGEYRFLGYVHHPDGREYGQGEGEMAFDPGIFVDDDGKVWLYTAFASVDAGMQKNINRFFHMNITGNGSYVMELEPDMLTIRSHKPLIPGGKNSAGTGFEGHEFYEASSMRKFNGRYYFIYSSILSHELAYAMSDYPDRGFRYGGALHSNGNVGYNGQRQPSYYWGNNHGSVEYINGKYYVFGHRQTNYSEVSRQGIAEEIHMDEQGMFLQAEMTSCGLNGGPLRADGVYPAGIACVLHRGKGNPKITVTGRKKKQYPMITQEYRDGIEEESQYIANVSDGTVIGYKYFTYETADALTVAIRGEAEGKLLVYQEAPGSGAEDTVRAVGEIKPYGAFTCGRWKIPCALWARYRLCPVRNGRSGGEI